MIPEIPVVAALFVSSRYPESILLFRRLKADVGGGLWEMPGGKIDDGETSEEALVREIKEELDIRVQDWKYLGKISHSYPQLAIELHVYRIDISHLEWKLKDHDASAWMPWSHLKSVNLSAADQAFFDRFGSNLEKTLFLPP